MGRMDLVHLNASVTPECATGRRIQGALRPSWTYDSSNQSKLSRFVACYVLKVNLNSPNMQAGSELDSLESHTSQKESVGIGLRKTISLGSGIRSEVSSRAFPPAWVRMWKMERYGPKGELTKEIIRCLIKTTCLCA